MTSPAKHAATVRDAHDTLIEAVWSPDDVAEWVAAVDALQAQAEAALDREAGTSDALDEMRAERDRFKEQWRVRLEHYQVAATDNERLAARVSELEAALREIAAEPFVTGRPASAIARAALDKDKR